MVAMEVPGSSLPSREPAAGGLADRQLLDLCIHHGSLPRPRFPGASLCPSERGEVPELAHSHQTWDSSNVVPSNPVATSSM